MSPGTCAPANAETTPGHLTTGSDVSILLSAQGLTASYGARPLFEGVNFTVEEGDRIGLIGPNGAGKSTLLRMMADAAGSEHTQTGLVSRRRGLRVGYLAQVPRFAAGATVASVVAGVVPERPRRLGTDARRRASDGAAVAGGPAAAPASRPRRRSRRCRADGRSGWRWPGSWRRSRICCCSTSRPTTSTSRASNGSNACSRAAGSRPSR